MWVINDLMRFEISRREINVQSLCKKWLRKLVKRRWFRQALSNPPEVRVTGVDRSPPVVLGPVPKPELYDLISEVSAREHSSHVRYWRGRKVAPVERRLIRSKRSEPKKPPSPYRYALGSRPRWRFLWPKGLLEEVVLTDGFLSRNCFLEDSFSREVLDHPFVSLEWVFYQKGRKRGHRALYTSVPPPASLLERVRAPPASPFEDCGGVRLWSGRRRKCGLDCQ
ncbi:RNA-dependent RNA polymerase [Erysiphe necator associated ourmia-like virus 22]|nr:RNA-dependent RNA polymerase [Erysiphe necator associated ourmia-like virus 22]